MTPPAPQHCAHECVCGYFHKDSAIAHRDGTPCMRNHEGCKSCVFDSRKAAAISEHEHQKSNSPEFSICNNSACRIYQECCEEYPEYEHPPCAKYRSNEHDERVRKEERQIMAKALTDIIKHEWMCDLAEICYIIECVGNDNYDPFKTMRRGEHQ